MSELTLRRYTVKLTLDMGSADGSDDPVIVQRVADFSPEEAIANLVMTLMADHALDGAVGLYNVEVALYDE